MTFYMLLFCWMNDTVPWYMASAFLPSQNMIAISQNPRPYDILHILYVQTKFDPFEINISITARYSQGFNVFQMVGHTMYLIFFVS